MIKQIAIVAVVLMCLGSRAGAVKVGDVTRLSGRQSNILVGVGLVAGLQGSGDGGSYLPAIRPLAQMLVKLNNNVDLRDLLDADSVALVTVTAVLPPRGVHKGDTVDVYVNTIGPAKSIKGGRLLIVPLVSPMDTEEVFANAQGLVVLEDPTTRTSGIVPRGAIMERTLAGNVVREGKLTLILQDSAADWTTASTIAKIVNDAEGTGETLAEVRDDKTIEITLPVSERKRPDSFISRIQRLPVPQLPTEARVQINPASGTIIITGDVEISPVVISHKGLTIQTVTPQPQPTPRTPVVNERRAIALDTTKEGGGRLQDLLDAMDMIRVPNEDRIQIIKELHRTGKLHAKLIISGQAE